MVAAGPPCSARIDAAVQSSSAFSRHVSNVVKSSSGVMGADRQLDQLLRQIRVQFLARESLQVIVHADTLTQRLVHLERQRAPQQRLASSSVA